MSDLVQRLRHVIQVDGIPLSRPDSLHLEAADKCGESNLMTRNKIMRHEDYLS